MTLRPAIWMYGGHEGCEADEFGPEHARVIVTYSSEHEPVNGLTYTDDSDELEPMISLLDLLRAWIDFHSTHHTVNEKTPRENCLSSLKAIVYELEAEAAAAPKPPSPASSP